MLCSHDVIYPFQIKNINILQQNQQNFILAIYYKLKCQNSFLGDDRLPFSNLILT